MDRSDFNSKDTPDLSSPSNLVRPGSFHHQHHASPPENHLNSIGIFKPNRLGSSKKTVLQANLSVSSEAQPKNEMQKKNTMSSKLQLEGLDRSLQMRFGLKLITSNKKEVQHTALTYSKPKQIKQELMDTATKEQKEEDISNKTGKKLYGKSRMRECNEEKQSKDLKQSKQSKQIKESKQARQTKQDIQIGEKKSKSDSQKKEGKSKTSKPTKKDKGDQDWKERSGSRKTPKKQRKDNKKKEKDKIKKRQTVEGGATGASN